MKLLILITYVLRLPPMSLHNKYSITFFKKELFIIKLLKQTVELEKPAHLIARNFKDYQSLKLCRTKAK